MKKILTLVLAFALALTLCGAAFAEGYSGDLKVWVADAAVDFTNAQIDAFKAANPDYANMNVTVEAVGEGDAASKVITDVAAAADIFGFAQDQLARMVAAGAVMIQCFRIVDLYYLQCLHFCYLSHRRKQRRSHISYFHADLRDCEIHFSLYIRHGLVFEYQCFDDPELDL